MGILYYPKKLQQVKEEVAKKHQFLHEIAFNKDDQELKQMIIRLTSMRKEDIPKECLLLNKRDLLLISSYIPHNYYRTELKARNHDMSNLFEILKIKNLRELYQALFRDWQDAFSNEECNCFLKELLCFDNMFSEIIEEKMTVSFFKDALSSKSIPIFFGKAAMKRRKMGQTVGDLLECYGIEKASVLSRECELLFYTFCEKIDYERISKQALVDKIESLNYSQLHMFLENFLQRMTLEELEKYTLIWKYLKKRVGKKGSKLYNDFFDQDKEDLQQKYNDWMNRQDIIELFGTDERSAFWKRYRFENVVHYSYSNSLAMETEHYVAVEFLGTAAGPAYIFRKSDFYELIRFRSRCTNLELRQYFLHDSPYQYRQEHRQSWRENLDEYLKYYCGIKEL